MASQKNNLFKKNKKYLWMKIKSHSSLVSVWPKTIHKEYVHLPLCLPIYVLVFSLFTTEVKASPVNDKAVFNIPRQRADLSLINFAEQADITLLFPLDKIQQLQTNTIAGEYSIINALQILLDGTGLQPHVSEDGQISILIDPSFERTDNMANYKKNGVSSAVLAVLSTMATLPAIAETAAQEPLPVPAFLGLGGTPLNEGLVVMADFLPRWKRENGTEKTHLVVLTDGEAQSTGVCKAPSDYVDRWYSYHLGYNTILRDRQTGKTYSTAKNSGYGITSELIRVIRDRYEWCNVLGFRLCQSRELGHFLSRMDIWDTEPYKKQMRQEKVAVVKTSAYNELYVIALNVDDATEMQVSAEPTKRELRSAFKKSLKGKAANRRLLSSFAGQIA